MTVPTQLQRLPRRHKKPAPRKRASLFLGLALVLATLLLLAMAGCSPAEAQEPQPERPESGRPAAAQRACPPGHAVEWLSNTEMQCLKEIP